MTHIVIVDDEADTHMLYKLRFKKIFPNIGENLKLVSFLSARECLDYLQNPETPKVDVVLSDINMPEMDGFSLLKQIRALSPQLPVYMVSAYESADFRQKALQLGASRFLSKPVDFTALRQMLLTDLQIPEQ
ncbi:hypothetical protein BDW_13590 [Bdellovibrio bacteriovorus W]|nr:hypothetical protein BDW_13590 [Bdellovibrio bacteriovorus W]